jgi:hypothetical protein
LLVATIASVAAVPADVAGRKEYIRNLPIADQQKLLRSLERYTELDSAEQQKLRELHAAIDRHPRSAQLSETLEKYHEWLKTLRPEERAELLELNGTERMARVEQLMQKHRDEIERRRPRGPVGDPALTRDDQRIIANWVDELVWSQRETLIKGLPKERRKQLDSRSEPQQRRELAFFAFQNWRDGKTSLPDDEVARLIAQLSPEARSSYQREATPDARMQLVKQWIVQSTFSRFSPGSMRRSWASVSAEELDRFMKQDLPPEERKRLLDLPREQLNEELRQLYLRRMQRDDGPRHDRPHRPPFGRPGPGGPGGPGGGPRREFGPPPNGGPGAQGRGGPNRPRPPRAVDTPNDRVPHDP